MLADIQMVFLNGSEIAHELEDEVEDVFESIPVFTFIWFILINTGVIGKSFD